MTLSHESKPQKKAQSENWAFYMTLGADDSDLLPWTSPLLTWSLPQGEAGMKTRFTEAQIIGVLKEAEAGGKIADLCRKHGISDATYYNWKAKFGGMTVSDA